MKTPWQISDGVIDLLAKACSSRVLIEFGSGSGTDRLADAGFEIYSIESDPNWIRPASRQVLLSPIENNWYKHDQVEQFLAGIFSTMRVGAVLIDGPPGRVGRWGVLSHWRTLDLAELLIVDDVHRDAESDICKSLVALTGRHEIVMNQDGKAFSALMKR